MFEVKVKEELLENLFYFFENRGVFGDGLGDFETDFVASYCLGDRFVINLHGIDGLRECSIPFPDLDSITNIDSAAVHKKDGNADFVKVMGNFTNRCVWHRFPPDD